VEGLEALRLLSSATQAHALPGIPADHDLLTDSHHQPVPLGNDTAATLVSSAAWDAALTETHLAELLSGPFTGAHTTASAPAASTSATGSDQQAIASGLSQLNRYLNRAWYRAGIPVQLHDDSSQAVYATLLQTMGAARFGNLVGEVGHWGIRDVFSRETSEGIALFRAVDMVKKRAQRERVHQSLESVDVPAEPRDQAAGATLRAALQEAIDRTLNPREAALIQETMMGKTPAEIALQWGVAAKTVSNEKSRVLQKLREALADHEWN
jgi:RNA polymerase sigma factor (sigma-70 family)